MKRTNMLLIVILCFSSTLIMLPGKASAHPSPTPHYAQSELIYKIDENSAVNAQMNFSLVAPKSPGTKYWRYEGSRTIPTPDVIDVQVQDDLGGRVNLEKQSGPDSTTIQIDFKIYPGEQLNYSISYKARGLVSKDGPEYQLKTPLGGMNMGADGWPHDNFVVTISGPPKAKLFTYEPSEVTITGENLSYETQLEPPTSFDGILGTWYKSPAYYELNLRENITNRGEERTTDFQFDLAIFNREDDWQTPALIETTWPLESIYVDEENNCRGVFNIGTIHPGESKELQIKLVYQVNVYDPGLADQDAGDISEVPTELDQYLKSLDYWPVKNQTIQQAANEAVDGESNSYLAAKKIVEYVNDRLEYDNQSYRLGALQAYLYRWGDCSEYTDLSITLARAAGLPARACYGWGYRENKLVGHVWPEFYFPNVGWQPADPTWVDTGGRVSPGGLRLRVHLSGRPFGKFAPALAGTSESYLGRLDTIHIQRSLRGLKSEESYIRYYRGAKPEVEESVSVSLLTGLEAAKKFILAAEFAIDRASNLLETKKEREDLTQKLARARDFLKKAKNENDPNQILDLSQKSLKHSSKVIKTLGKPPQIKEGWRLPEIPLTLLGIGLALAAAVAGLWYFFKRSS